MNVYSDRSFKIASKMTWRRSVRQNPLADGASRLSILRANERARPDLIEVSREFVSAPRCVGCKRVIRIAGIHKVRTRGAQQFFDLLDRFPNHAARLAGLNLAF